MQPGFGKKYKNGTKGGNTEGLLKQEKQKSLQNPTIAIIKFKHLLRSSFDTNLMESNLREFLSILEASKQVQDLYQITDLLNDYKDLENQYEKLREAISFVPFWKSFSSIIKKKTMAVQPNQIDEKKVLLFLHSTVLSKLTHIEGYLNTGTVIDLEGFLNETIRSLEKLKRFKKQQKVTQHLKSFQDSLLEKITSASNIVTKEILPEIAIIFRKIEENTEKLFDEIMQHQIDTLDQIQQKEELKKMIKMQLVFDTIESVASQLAVFGPHAALAGSIIGSAAIVAKDVSIDQGKFAEYSQTNLLEIEALAVDKYDDIPNMSEIFGDRLMMIDKAIQLVKKENQTMGDVFEDKLDACKKEVAEEETENPSSEIKQTRMARVSSSVKSPLMNALCTEITSFAINQAKENNEIEKYINYAGAPIGLYNMFKSGKEQLDSVDSAIKDLGDQYYVTNDKL